jgi:hypothetical protein
MHSLLVVAAFLPGPSEAMQERIAVHEFRCAAQAAVAELLSIEPRPVVAKTLVNTAVKLSKKVVPEKAEFAARMLGFSLDMLEASHWELTDGNSATRAATFLASSRRCATQVKTALVMLDSPR